MITLFEVMKITTEPSKGGCVVSTHEFVMGYTPLQRTRKGNKIGSSRGTALHSAGSLGKGQMRHGVVTTTPAPERGAGKRILLGRGQFLRIVFPELRFIKKHTTCSDLTLLRGPHPAVQKGGLPVGGARG